MPTVIVSKKLDSIRCVKSRIHFKPMKLIRSNLKIMNQAWRGRTKWRPCATNWWRCAPAPWSFRRWTKWRGCSTSAAPISSTRRWWRATPSCRRSPTAVSSSTSTRPKSLRTSAVTSIPTIVRYARKRDDQQFIEAFFLRLRRFCCNRFVRSSELFVVLPSFT